MTRVRKPARKPSMTSRIVGYRYEGTIVDLPRVEAILRRAKDQHLVTQYAAKQYGRRGEGVDCVWFNGTPGRDLRKIRAAVQALVRTEPGGQKLQEDPPGTLRVKDVGDWRVITLTGVHDEGKP